MIAFAIILVGSAALYFSFNNLILNFKTMLSKVADVSNITASAAQELSSNSEEVNASTEQVTSTMQELIIGAKELTSASDSSQDEISNLTTLSKTIASSVQNATKDTSDAGNLATKERVAAKDAEEKMKSLLNMIQETSQDNKIIDDNINISTGHMFCRA